MINEMVKKINSSTKVKIYNEIHNFKSMVYYTSEENSKCEYIKCVLDNNKILEFIPSDNLIMLGTIIEGLAYEAVDDEENEILFKGEKYKKITEDYQIVKCIKFGDPIEVEGELIYTDFEGINNGKMISLAEVVRTEERADVELEELSIEKIEIIE